MHVTIEGIQFFISVRENQVRVLFDGALESSKCGKCRSRRSPLNIELSSFTFGTLPSAYAMVPCVAIRSLGMQPINGLSQNTPPNHAQLRRCSILHITPVVSKHGWELWDDDPG